MKATVITILALTVLLVLGLAPAHPAASEAPQAAVQDYFEGPWEREPNNSYDQANGPLRSHRTYYGHPNDEKDYFSIYLYRPGTISVDLSGHTGQHVQLQLFYQSTANRVAYDLEAPYHLEYSGEAGKYFIYISTGEGHNTATRYALRATFPMLHKATLPMVQRSFSYANFSIAKSAAPTQLNVEQTVTYTVLLRNEGDLPGKLDEISDTLPRDFSFEAMVAGSDVMTRPTENNGTLVWDAEIDVAPKTEVKLVYRVRAGTQYGLHTNKVTATTLAGFPPEAPAKATVEVTRPHYFEDDFEDGTDEWTPYTNARRANEDMWFWDLGEGRNGGNAYTHNALNADEEKSFAHDALAMHLGEGAEDWTDYRYTVWIKVHDGRQAGAWLRGHYRDAENPGQWVTGYYFTVKIRDDERDSAKLFQLRTDEEHGDEIYDYYWYHYQNPLLLAESHLVADVEKENWYRVTVEVRGNSIKGYVNDELAIDHTDTVGSVFLTGTIGFYTYGSSPDYAVVSFDDVKVEPLD
jgi:uncharacterized repeat protein (TIGR01451 family)